MFARVTTIQAPPERFEEGVRHVRDNVIPFARQLRGFKGGYWIGDRKTGKTIGITFWQDEETLRDSAAKTAPRREESVRSRGGRIISVESFEVTNQA